MVMIRNIGLFIENSLQRCWK